ncbi:PREDICTED: uncharacterized protein LOC106819501, partial [Priapulus caudatus]|uniref:Uncharacterized protein LOC106819501 n=1 Tax=Priapulus caudatus TaxID=37621 RepID=A0ABM1F589_PRICU
MCKGLQTVPTSASGASSPAQRTPHKVNKRCLVFTPRQGKRTNPGKSGTTNLKKSRNYKARACTLLHKSNYEKMLALLWGSSQAFRAALTKFLRKKVYSEAKEFGEKPSVLRQNLSLANINAFNWNTAIAEIEAGMPLIFNTYCGMMEKRRRSSGRIVSVALSKPRLGASIGIMLANRQPRAYKLLPAWIGVELLRSGCKKKVFSCLSHVGICQTASSAQRCVDKIASEFDKELRQWKNDIEKDYHNLKSLDLFNCEVTNIDNYRQK